MCIEISLTGNVAISISRESGSPRRRSIRNGAGFETMNFFDQLGKDGDDASLELLERVESPIDVHSP